MMQFKLGCNPSPEPPRLAFGDYVDDTALPPVPPTFGHESVYPPRGWGMFLNDHLGICTVAAGIHTEMLWRAVVNRRVLFNDIDAKHDYFAITGGKDSGASLVQLARYWQYTGFRDSMGQRHKILAYMHVNPTHLSHVDAATYLFDATVLNISVGDEEEKAFVHQQPWLDPNSKLVGYHCVPLVGRNPQYRQIITWGGDQDVGDEWFVAKTNEVIAVLTDENLNDGRSLEGFNLDALKADLLKLR